MNHLRLLRRGALLALTAVFSAAAAAVDPNDQLSFPDRRVAAGHMGSVTLPGTPVINGYTPVLRFRLKCADGAAHRPEVLIGKTSLPELDDRGFPRLADRADASEGGDGVYTYNLNKLLHPVRERRVRIGLEDNSSAFTLSEIEFFWRTEARSLVSPRPRKDRDAFRRGEGPRRE